MDMSFMKLLYFFDPLGGLGIEPSGGCHRAGFVSIPAPVTFLEYGASRRNALKVSKSS